MFVFYEPLYQINQAQWLMRTSEAHELATGI